jgi:endoglucanase
MRGNWAAGLLGAVVCVIAILGTGRTLAFDGAPSLKWIAGSAYTANPLRGWRIFRYDKTSAAADVASFRAHGMAHDAELMERISRRPIATWFTDDTTHVLKQITALTTDANKHESAAVIVAYDIPGRNCTENDTAGDHEYLRWIGEIAAGIGQRDTIVILEPDAIPFVIAGCHIKVRLLGRAVKELVRAGGARVYIDAGNPSWVNPVSLLVAPLREADIRQAAGFSLNVANFQTDAANIVYGRELSQLLGGAHFVIDTSRNGNGPDTAAAGISSVCDPPGRALGSPPTTDTGVPGVDAYLWIKSPGSSDGRCRPGAPPSGEWWPQYALELAANSVPGDALAHHARRISSDESAGGNIAGDDRTGGDRRTVADRHAF